mmetsp:Transcript_6536/g.8872  ORF Transcript_6536/g.8872 Transcript_6536/m.8872 type:complete len:199 (-) Transcript_6536:48-644(-)|eukprot:CAMPEP_0196591822 /NCGR_PEP_ID=MMETSP1081-20130531/70970_1 /TAXON_ID=36882 /ORGANISM="Pyramimonas amylifera, Strain CCMP720" /LENGTH=198 /DNA_ID=CAMNT_0041915317 /DNA_START=1 /DNA_END=597 /DNA_ORIENTATION=-
MKARQGRFTGSALHGRGAVEEALSSLIPQESSEGMTVFSQALFALGLSSLTSVDVIHCSQSFALVLQHSQGWKLVYSGDTRPSAKLAKASQGATLLIHEATFEDGLLDEAVAKRHSTTQEAIQTGVDAQVHRTILTHFSQRYPKIPVIDESYTEKTCVAFDLMSVKFVDLEILPKVLPCLKILFASELFNENGDLNHE